MEATPYWKKIWCSVIGRNNLISEYEIKNILQATKQNFIKGLCMYERFTQKSFEDWKKESSKTAGTAGNMTVEQMAKKISVIMNVETITAWKIFCNFLMFEYHILLEDIMNSAEVEIYNSRLFEQAWLFYSSERLYLIKTWKHILEACTDENHRLHRLSLNFMKVFDFIQIRKSLFEQFQYLLNEITRENTTNCHSVRDWVNRNQQEQFEILTCIILTQEVSPLTMDEFKVLFSIFKQHNFTSDPITYLVLEHANPEDLRRVRILEVLALFVGFNSCWDDLKTWRPYEKELEELLMTTSYQDYLCVLLLAWSTLQMTLPAKIAAEKFQTHYHKFTKAVLKEKVFLVMLDIISDPILKNETVFTIIQKSFYNLLNYICNKFDEEGSLMEHDGLITLCIKLLDNPEIAGKFIHDKEDNASMIYRVLYELFPCTYYLYTEIVLKLIQHEGLQTEVSQILSNFQHYTEETTERYNESVVRLMSVYCPCDCIRINVHSEAVIFPKYDKTFIKYEAEYNYFEYSEEMIKQTLSNPDPPEEATRNMELYLKIVHGVLKCNLIDLHEERHLLGSINNVLLNTFKKPNINYNVMRICFEIYETLMPDHGEQIIEMMAVNNFLPIVTKNPIDLNNYFDKNFVNPNFILLTLADLLNRGEYDILFTYFKIAKLAPQTYHNALRIQIPNLIFMFIHLLPLYQDLLYKDINDKYKIILHCLETALDVLTEKPDLKCEYDKIIYDFCYTIVVNYEPTVQIFLRIFRISNTYLHTCMLKESNWNNTLTSTITNCVKTCVSIIINVFTLHNKGERPLYDTVFYRSFFNLNVKPSCVKLLMGYLDHAFDPALPKLTCQLFKKIAVNPTIPILALLEMTPYQIQNIFLEKLRDPLEEENIKVSILELITLCIEKQSGLTAAFFDIKQHSSKLNYSDCDSISTFMEEYLENVQKSTTYLKSPVQGAVLDLFHTLWMYRKDILVQHLTQGEKFWLTLTDPLFRELKLSNKTYSQIFNILTLELYRSKGENDRIKSILDKFFEKDGKYAKIWCNHIISSLDETYLEIHGHTLLRAWKHFIMMIALNYPSCLENVELQKLITESCIEGLIRHFTQPDDIRILMNCADLYLYLTKRWPNENYRNHAHLVASLTKVFNYVGKYYEHINSAFKETMLSIAIQTVTNLKKLLPSSHGLVEEFLYSIADIFDKEYQRIISEDVKSTTDRSYNEWLLLLIFGNRLIAKGFGETHPAWFGFNKFLSRVMISTGLFTGNPKLFPIAKIAMQCLINYGKTTMYKDFLSMDFESFFDSTRPPKIFMNIDVINCHEALPWHFEQWWLTYTGVIQLMTLLLGYLHKFNLNIFFAFVSIHEDVIQNVLKLPSVIAEKTALGLTTDCLHFIFKLLEWRQEWKVYQGIVYFNIINTIYDTINSVSFIFQRPMVLTFYDMSGLSLKLIETIPSDRIVNIMDQLVKVIIVAGLCLLKASPNILALLAPPVKGSYVNDVEIDFDFHISRLHQDSQTLTYSTLLSLLHFLYNAFPYSRMQVQKRDKPVELDEKANHLVFVCRDFARSYKVLDRYTLRASEASDATSQWLTRLNLKNIIRGLEVLGSLIATQSYISFNIRELRYGLKQHFKRELYSELTYFYDFVRKRFLDHHYRIIENMVFRRYTMRPLPYAVNLTKGEKYVSYVKKCSIFHSSDDDESETSDSSDYSREYDVDYDKMDTSVFFSTADFDDENSGKIGDGTAISEIGNTICGRKLLDGRVVKIPLDKVLLRYPDSPRIRDSDYLLYLMHWFMFFCDLTP